MMSREGREEERSMRGVWVSVETECGRLGDNQGFSGADDQKAYKSIQTENKTKIMSTINNISMFNLHYQGMMP